MLVEAHTDPAGHGVATDLLPPDGHVYPTGHTDWAVMPLLGHTLPAVHVSAAGILIELQYVPGGHSVMAVDVQ